MEDPSEDFVRCRDYIDCKNCMQLDDYQKEHLLQGFSPKMSKAALEKFKISKVSFTVNTKICYTVFTVYFLYLEVYLLYTIYILLLSIILLKNYVIVRYNTSHVFNYRGLLHGKITLVSPWLNTWQFLIIFKVIMVFLVCFILMVFFRI